MGELAGGKMVIFHDRLLQFIPYSLRAEETERDCCTAAGGTGVCGGFCSLVPYILMGVGGPRGEGEGSIAYA